MQSDTTWKLDREPPRGTGVLTKAFDIIDQIAARQGRANASELAESTGISRPTAYRILAALTARGIIRCDPATNLYQIGYRTLDIAQQVWSSSDLSSVSAVELRRLRDITGETTYLAVAQGSGVLSIGRFQGPHSRRSAAALGSIKPMHCTSQGKALLAFLPETQRAQFLLKPLETRTERTIVDLAALEEELASIRNRGYAVDDEEIVSGTRCVGAPILDASGTAIAAVSLAGPSFRVTHDRLDYLAKEVVEATRIIGAQMRPPTDKGPRSTDFAPVSNHAAFIGGAPQWDATHKQLIWIDHLAPALFESKDGGTRLICEFDTRISAMALTERFGAFIFLGSRAIRVRDMAMYDLPAPVMAAARLPGGDRILLALKDDRTEETQLVWIDHDGGLSNMQCVAGKVSGLCVSLDGKTVLAISSSNGVISQIDTVSGKNRVLSRIPRASGVPVSCTHDNQGRIWIALSYGWSVARLDDLGEITERLPIPVRDPTGLCFGGTNGTELFVTTRRYGLDRSDLANAPLSGHTIRFVE